MTSSFDWDTFLAATAANLAGGADLTEPDTDQRWSTWPETAHTLDRGPQPFPAWVVQHAGAIDTELGVLKTGKEADAFLIERALPAPQRTGADGEVTLLVAKRYRAPERASFHRSAEYTAGRTVKDTREGRAIARGTTFGREVAAAQWARTEFDMLGRLWSAGLPVPYPVQIVGTEVCMEFIGTDDGGGAVAAPRMQETRPGPGEARRWAQRLRGIVVDLAQMGLVHGDLSPYNILIDSRGGASAPVVIDVPQVIDLIGNPGGPEFLRRDCENTCTWLRAHGAGADADPAEWFEEAMAPYQ